MAVIRIPEDRETLEEKGAVTAFLAGYGIDHERWVPSHPVAPGASAEEILEAYKPEIDRLRAATSRRTSWT